MRPRIARRVALTLATLLLTMTGCSNDSETANGIVQFTDGEPVQSGSVEFRSLDDGSRYASKITSRGTFRLSDEDGRVHLPPGDYEVVVVQVVLTEDLAAEAHEHGRTVPRGYADYYTSGLTVTREANDETPLEVVLEPDGP
ncbi:carboxypeptidase-like regulatory domain-containing protein [Rhodopirellula halodulae]|uniref:carboxypeptidase-like regulatory domain-containing protein n=1 Tax=Rhodopirellula halodulae TaxID=2894198 RepID=UPI001E3D2F28|nr:carboxypeptidase-like regulatory domain-containing protein [Rhodopirellula sp. JC737]MCC9655899.1 carboxypeptidase-like regulatory domain-containing protein [Rhodopirellula sp. JC737]